MSQQAPLNHEIMRAQAEAQAQAQARHARPLPKMTANPPQYDGKQSEDIELHFFTTEKFYSEYKHLMEANTSEFVDMVFCNFGPVPQTFLREVINSLVREDGTQEPLTWGSVKNACEVASAKSTLSSRC